MTNNNETALILEGGGTRGVFTSGVLDCLMKHQIEFPYVTGVSAGACNAVDYVSGQIGRTKACVITEDKNNSYIGLKQTLKNKTLLDMDMLFERYPNEIFPFDYDAYFNSGKKCELVVTDCITGQAKYLEERNDRKRLMDICGALIGLLITGIAFVFVAPAIYVKSPGPIFFSQVRVGKNGRFFKIYKFRSMYLDAEERKKELMEQNKMSGLMFKMDDDPRIIKGIGHFIRNTSIDELPQFWNILKGDMSLVGTRPPTKEEYAQYSQHHKIRLSFRPGLTGMWQVSGRSDITDFEEVVRLDEKYIEEWSILLDIRILFRTVVVVLTRKGSE